VSTLAGDACDISEPDAFPMPAAAVNYEVGVSYENAVNVSIVKAGTGSGRVVSTFPGIDCGTTCSAYQPGQLSTKVSETPDAGSVFVGWSGGCVGTAGSCIFNTGSGTAIAATFNKVATPPPPTPSPKPSSTPAPSSSPKPTATAGPSGTPRPGGTPTPGPTATTGPASAPGATAAATVEPGQTGGDASATPTGGASVGAGASVGPIGTNGPAAPAGSSTSGGIPTVVVIGLLLLLVLVGAGGLVIGARTGRRPKA